MKVKGEGDLAVLILGDEGSLAEAASTCHRQFERHEALKRLNLPRKLLPPKAKEGSWLTLDIVGGREALPEGSQPQNIKLDNKATAAARLREGDYKRFFSLSQ